MSHKIVVTGSINRLFDIRETKKGDHMLNGSITCDGHKAKFYPITVFSKQCDPHKFARDCQIGAEVRLLIRPSASVNQKNTDYADLNFWVENYEVLSPAANNIPPIGNAAQDPTLSDIPF